MSFLDQKIFAWGGPFCCLFLGVGLVLAGFVPPPAPTLSAEEVAVIYQADAGRIRAGMFLSLFGLAGWAAMVGVVSIQMRRMQGVSRLPAYVQLGTGSIGVLTVMFPVMIFAIAAFRPERAPAMTQMLNDVGWLIIIPAFPTFLAQLFAIALGIFQDKSVTPVFPRWAAYANCWIAVLLVPGGFSYFVKSGPFAWDGLIAFWIAAGAFFVWLLLMSYLLLRAIKDEQSLST